jgi:hypothetical protein
MVLGLCSGLVGAAVCADLAAAGRWAGCALDWSAWQSAVLWLSTL